MSPTSMYVCNCERKRGSRKKAHANSGRGMRMGFVVPLLRTFSNV